MSIFRSSSASNPHRLPISRQAESSEAAARPTLKRLNSKVSSPIKRAGSATSLSTPSSVPHSLLQEIPGYAQQRIRLRSARARAGYTGGSTSRAEMERKDEPLKAEGSEPVCSQEERKDLEDILTALSQAWMDVGSPRDKDFSRVGVDEDDTCSNIGYRTVNPNSEKSSQQSKRRPLSAFSHATTSASSRPSSANSVGRPFSRPSSANSAGRPGSTGRSTYANITTRLLSRGDRPTSATTAASAHSLRRCASSAAILETEETTNPLEESRLQRRESLKTLQNLRQEQMLSAIRPGLRTALLGFSAPKIGMARSAATIPEVPPSYEQAVRIYGHFRRLQTLSRETFEAANAAAALERADDDEEMLDGQTLALNDEEDDLKPVGWNTFFDWLEEEEQFGIDAAVKAALRALLRGLKVWRAQRSSDFRCQQGVSLTMLLEWIYPCARRQDLSKMLCWMANFEIKKLQQETPRVIDAEERKQLVRIFLTTYSEGRPTITALEVAGGRNPDSWMKRATLVDTKTAQAVFGDADIDITKFLEMMCPRGIRGHEGVSQVMTEDGVRLIRCRNEAIGFDGWIREDPAEHEIITRRAVKALEEEAWRWKRC
eukprot:TRINITY_DN97113_c0_g1_i1.p1 TRINITY_DN97113_c0_g1~~TRINITY_DN97113_c0_g1_i1.p1  ORF type:complete len:618 (+),score=105.04 TRINITY_DN97113_c0_g1_i1:51-1856(+)